jgi:hypothetical protein
VERRFGSAVDGHGRDTLPGYYTNLHAVHHMMVDYIPVF